LSELEGLVGKIRTVGGLKVLPLETTDTEGTQSVGMRATMALTGISGDDACMDFYYASPSSVEAVGAHRKMAVEPIVRVMFPTGMLLSMMERLKEIAPQLPRLGVPQ
jgi:hypothetical protein